MPTPLTDSSAWVDIIEPLAPPPMFSTLQILAAGMVLLGILLLILRWWWRQPQQRARWQLRRIQHQATLAKPDLRLLTWQLRAALCVGLRVTHLHQRHMPVSEQVEWQAFSAALTRLCYQPRPPAAEEFHVLLQQAGNWLKLSKVQYVNH